MSEESTNEVIKTEVLDLEPASDALEIIERRNKLWEKVMAVAIKSTSTSDWIDQDGKPWLQGSGSEKVARRFGVRIFDIEQVREDLEDDRGKYYLYTTMGKVSLPGVQDIIEVIGTCSSRDKFLGTNNDESKYRKYEDVDVGNIKKKSYTNFVGNGITRLLGLRNLTWEDLGKYGISSKGKTKVSYDKGKKKSSIKEKGSPVWDWETPEGEHLLYAKLGKHFSKEFLETLSMKMTKNDPKKFWCKYSEEILEALRLQYKEVENGTTSS